MRIGFAALGAALAIVTVPAAAQNKFGIIPPAVSTELPPGISVRKTAEGDVYVDAKGRVLYGMDTGVLRLRTRNPNGYCTDACAAVWEPVAPPPGITAAAPVAAPAGLAGIDPALLQGLTPDQLQALAQGRGGAGGQGGGGRGGRGAAAAPSGPDWTVVQGANGPQLAYKRSHLVFVRKGPQATSTEFDGEPDRKRDEPATALFNVLRFVPPAPKLAQAPVGISQLYVDGGYAFVDAEQRVLYVQDKPAACAACASPAPLKAGLIAQDIGEWSVARSGDLAQWHYRGKPVFVSRGEPKTASIPAGARVLRP